MNLSSWSLSNINKCDWGFGVQHAVDTCYRVLCQTSVAESCVCSDACGNVHCWANTTLSWFGLSNRRVINRARVNIWSALLCQSPGTGWCWMFSWHWTIWNNWVKECCGWGNMPNLNFARNLPCGKLNWKVAKRGKCKINKAFFNHKISTFLMLDSGYRNM